MACGLADGARVPLSAPMYRSGLSAITVLATPVGCEITLEPRVDVETALRRTDAHRVAHPYRVPRMHVRLLRVPSKTSARRDLGSVRHVASTGTLCPPEVERQTIEWWGR